MKSASAASSVYPNLQQPRIRCVPEYVSSSGQDAIEVAALAGLNLDPWQQMVLVDALGQRPDGKWSAFEVGLNVARQNGKGSVLEARELAGAFAFEEKLIIHSAHEQITSSEHFERILNLIEGVPEFEQRVMKVVRGKGSEAIWLRGGQRIFFKTRTGGGGRGLTGDLVVLDEAMIISAAMMAALVPTMAARSVWGNPQLWLAGSAIDQEKHENGVVFARARERAIAGADLAYLEWSAGVQDWLERHGLSFDPERPEIEQITPEMLDDPEMWSEANPGIGIRISEDHISKERGALGSREFAVERLGIGDPPDTSEDADRVISREVWRAAAEHDRANRITGRPVFALDANPEQTWASIAIAGKRDDGLFQFAVVRRERGTDWLVGVCQDLKANHPGCRVVIDKRGPLAEKIDALKRAHIRLKEVSTEDYGRACGGFFSSVTEGRSRYPWAQPLLDEALAGACKGKLGDGWKWDRRNSTTDLSPLVAVTLALYGAERAIRARAIDPNAILAS